jgi:hypothetical protein
MANWAKQRRPQGAASGAWRAAAGLLLFAAGYAVANRYQLTHDVVYRLAAGDPRNAVGAFAVLAAQATGLLAALVWLPRRWAMLLLGFAGVSILVNHGYSGLVSELMGAGTLAWMAAEARQAGNAAGAFGGAFMLAAVQAAAAVALFAGARSMLLRSGRLPAGRTFAWAGAALFLLPGLLIRPLDRWPEGAERNLYGLAWELASAAPPPAREAVTLVPDTGDAPRHIVWLIDESVAAAPFARLIAPSLHGVAHRDFGVAAALGHCSAPAQVALRSGVDVRHVGRDSDLRATPSIWGFAKRAGYRTILIDGQTAGAPQNLLLPPERALIDDFRSMAGGIDTDRRIARTLNAQMKSPGKSFALVVLRGVHFQYRDHYPEGTIPADAPVARQYDTALAWSKRGFFDTLLAGVDREAVAIVYTSDHGQNLAPGALPHCSQTPVADEFRVPLVAFVPDRLAARYPAAPGGGRSASQIFPATLGWMGYDRAAVAARYDHDLDAPTARYVWFGRSVIPVREGGEIAVSAGRAFPGTAADVPPVD